MSFIHLGIHSEYSVSDSLVRLPELVSAAAKDGMPALALTDLSNLYAAVKFYKACLGKGIQPILGSEIQLQTDSTEYIPKLTLLAMNETGWRNLTELVSLGYTEGLELGVPLVAATRIQQQSEGLLLLLDRHSDVGYAVQSGNLERAGTLLADWVTAFGDRVYLSVSRIGRPQEEPYLQDVLALAQSFQLPVIATNEVRFMAQSDFEAHEARVCIATGYVLSDEKRPRLYTDQQYFKTQAEMSVLFEDLPELLENTVELARRCAISLTLGKNYLPDFPVPEGYTIDTYFRARCQEGLDARLAVLYPQPTEDWAERLPRYQQRLDYEIDTILKMGFPGYFLIVMDFIQWAKENGVPVGPGRGSGAGSLVAYSLKITDLDPLAYDLLFERFLNPERVSMPDFDVDFCPAGRDRVIDYVARHYGREAVSQIITFGTMAAKAVVRDVARVQGKSYGLADRISKLIPKTPGISLQDALEEEPQLKELTTNAANPDFEDASDIWAMATTLEGLTRNVGKHAGGVLIAPGKITDFSAVYCDDEGSRVSQFDKDDVEQIGLVKFDFLGLRNLTVIESALKTINAERATRNEPAILLNELPLDDASAYRIFAEGKTTAVFQFESTGMKRMLIEAKPSKFEEIIAFVALYRPGPMDLIPDFTRRMHGEKFDYLHPLLSEVLKPTYGVMVYQEQVMQAAQVCAGYSLGGADLLRRAMGKKKPEEMALQRKTFVEGAAQKDIEAAKANEIFDYIEKFAGYGFNKSHAAAYALVAYHTAWLKAHYPSQFMAAVLTSEMQNTDTIVFLIEDCRLLGLTLLPPSVNQSDFQFRAASADTIVYGLGAIKGVGEGAMESVMKARQFGGRFRDVFDFCQRIDLRKANKRTLEALIKAGALDCFSLERAEMMAQLPDAIQAAEQARNNRESGMMDLFGEVEEIQRPVSRIPLVWSDEERLQGEKDTLGLYLTGHPMDVYSDELSRFLPARLNAIAATRRGSTTVIAGIVMDVAQFPGRILIRLDDGTGRLEVSCHAEKFTRYKQLLQVDAPVVLEVDIMEREGFDKPMGRMHKAFSIDDIRLKRASAIVLQLEEDQMSTQLAADLSRVLSPFTYGEKQRAMQRAAPVQRDAMAATIWRGIPVFLALSSPYSRFRIQLGEPWHVTPTDALLRALRAYYGRKSVRVDYQLNPKNATESEPTQQRLSAQPA